MLYDPLAYYDQLLRNPLAGYGLPRHRPEPTFPPLPREEEESILGGLGRKALGGLGYVGNLLDKYTGGRAVRGLLGGAPREALSLLPFSDALGITDESQAVSGKQLLEKAGMLDQGSEGFLPTAAGIAADMALSPGTYLSFGTRALTDAGKLAQKIGALPATTRGRIQGLTQLTPEAQQAAQSVGINTADILNKPLGGVANVGLPFTEGTVLGAGPGGEAFLDALAGVGNALGHGKYSPFRHAWEYGAAPVLGAIQRYGRPLFNPAYRNTISELGQEVAPQSYARQQQLQTAADKFLADQYYRMRASGVADATDALRDIREGITSPIGPQGQSLSSVGNELVGYADQLHQRAAQQGFDTPLLEELNWKTGAPLGYFMRHSALPEPKTLQDAWHRLGSGGGPVFNLHPSVLGKREDWTRGLDWRTHEELIQHPEFTKPLGQGLSNLDRLHQLGQMLPHAQANNLKSIMQALAGRDPNTPAAFTRHALDDWRDTVQGLIRRETGAEAVHEMLGRGLQPLGAPGSERFVPLSQDLFVNQLGFGEQNWVNAAQRVLDRARQAGVPVPAGVPLDQLANFAVNPEHLADATRVLQGFQTPTALKPLVGLGDWFTNLFKSLQTNPWPGFHTRNLVSGQLANLEAGLASRRGLVAARELLEGRPVGELSEHPWFAGRNLTPEQATEELQKLAYAHGVRQHGLHEAAETVGGVGGGDDIAKRFIGLDPFPGFLTEAKRQVTGLWQEPGGWNPLNVRGVAGAEKTRFAPAVHGEAIGQATEDLNRVSAFLEAGWQGYAPAQAAKMSKAAHGDYGALSDFERGVMRRLIPFYSWSRRVTPHVVQSILERPGGLYGSSAVAANEVRANQEQFIPEYLGGGLAIPVGEEKEGTQRYLTKLDVNPAEAVFENLRPNVADMGLSLLGQFNPLLKAPLEYVTGKQFFQGRNLEELHGPTDSTALNQIIMNSPLSRLYTTGRTLADPRKYERPIAFPVNLLTGARLSDVDVERQREFAARDAITEMLRGQPGVRVMEKPYVPKDQLENLSPQDVLLMRLAAGLDKRAAERRKKEEREKKVVVKK